MGAHSRVIVVVSEEARSCNYLDVMFAGVAVECKHAFHLPEIGILDFHSGYTLVRCTVVRVTVVVSGIFVHLEVIGVLGAQREVLEEIGLCVSSYVGIVHPYVKVFVHEFVVHVFHTFLPSMVFNGLARNIQYIALSVELLVPILM